MRLLFRFIALLLLTLSSVEFSFADGGKFVVRIANRGEVPIWVSHVNIPNGGFKLSAIRGWQKINPSSWTEVVVVDGDAWDGIVSANRPARSI